MDGGRGRSARCRARSRRERTHHRHADGGAARRAGRGRAAGERDHGSLPGRAHLLAASGAPREALKPALAVDLAAPSGGPGDPILYQALKLFERR
jgi:hypothetical protein